MHHLACGRIFSQEVAAIEVSAEDGFPPATRCEVLRAYSANFCLQFCMRLRRVATRSGLVGTSVIGALAGSPQPPAVRAVRRHATVCCTAFCTTFSASPSPTHLTAEDALAIPDATQAWPQRSCRVTQLLGYGLELPAIQFRQDAAEAANGTLVRLERHVERDRRSVPNGPVDDGLRKSLV